MGNAFVDFDEFKRAVDSFGDVVSKLQKEADVLNEAGSQLRRAIPGDIPMIQSLYRSADNANNRFSDSIQKIQAVIREIQQDDYNLAKWMGAN